ncbi:MAG TPA: hypothetical protein DCZ94_19180, partial [Lentisphaeria bacterium]|nr:hypothetical protein [Lentisphaeria bacterium]
MSASPLVLLFQGCYNYPAIPDAVNQNTYTALQKEQQKLIPEDCRILTLELAEQISIANNPDYLSAGHAVNAAWYRFYTSLSSYFPTITAGYT